MGIAAASVATASYAVVVVATSLAAKKDISAISLVHSDGATCELSSAQLPRNAESHHDATTGDSVRKRKRVRAR